MVMELHNPFALSLLNKKVPCFYLFSVLYCSLLTQGASENILYSHLSLTGCQCGLWRKWKLQLKNTKQWRNLDNTGDITDRVVTFVTTCLSFLATLAAPCQTIHTCFASVIKPIWFVSVCQHIVYQPHSSLHSVLERLSWNSCLLQEVQIFFFSFLRWR